ncbi:MAG: carboxylating nicotinate-nucleotide diphosphorylase [Bacteroidota bacterium]
MFDYLQPDYIQNFIRTALAEDVGDGDHTALSTIPAEAQGKAQLIIKDTGILAGVELAKMILEEVDNELVVQQFMHDGKAIKYGDIVLKVAGRSQSILKAERLLLNCMQRMSGIATFTKSMVDLLDGLPTKLLDTRKTTPNFRLCEKWACKIGGATNHRYALFDMILIKDNHVDYAGGIRQAIEKANDYVRKTGKDLKIEIEVRNLDELAQVLKIGGIFRIMLDNFSFENLRKAVEMVGNQYPTEASGGINETTIRQYAECGVDYISCGALTHHVKSLDMSLKAY